MDTSYDYSQFWVGMSVRLLIFLLNLRYFEKIPGSLSERHHHMYLTFKSVSELKAQSPFFTKAIIGAV